MKKVKLSKHGGKLRLGAGTIVVILVALVGLHLLTGSKADVPTTPTVPVCGERTASDVEEYTGTAGPSTAYVNEITPPSNEAIVYDRYWIGTAGQDSRWYIMTSESDSSASFAVYDATNDSLINTFTIAIPSSLQGQSTNQTFALDPAGNIYIGTYATSSAGGSISQWLWSSGDSSATLGWSTYTTALLTGAVYGYTDASNTYRIAAGVNSSPTNLSDTYNASTGASLGTNAIYGSDVQPASAHNNDLVVLNESTNTVYIWNSTASSMSFYMSGGSGNNTWSGDMSGANELSNGDIVVTSYGARSMFFFNASGAYLGSISSDVGSGAPLDTITNNSTVEVENNRIYYVAENPFSAPNKLSYITITNANLFLKAPQGAPFHLGLGANIVTPASYNYFVSGTTPSVNLTFNQWWQGTASSFTGTYTVRSMDQILNNQPGTQESFSIPANAAAYTSGTATVPLILPVTSPGQYEVNVQLLQNGSVVGASCTDYSVAAANDTFNPASMPNGNDTNGIYLANQLGQKLYRSSYTIDQCFPGVTNPTSATTLNCPASMDSDIAAAVSNAAQLGVTFDYQLGTGTTFDTAAISSGQWQRLVGLVVAHYPEVKDWECWNEPDNNSFSSPSAYVTTALEPCYTAIKAASSSNKVIGISNENYNVSNYQSYINAGALNYLDIVAFHSYTGWNKSFEEQGNVIPTIYNSSETGQIEQLQNYLSSKGYNGTLYDTESGFWNNESSEPYNYYDQGDKLVRKWVLEQSVGINLNSNFYNFGNYTVDGAYWALVGGQQNVVSPGGLAAINFHANIGGRTFLQWLPTGVPHTYAALFGPSGTSTSDVAVVWADDYNVNIHPQLSSASSMSVTSEYGATTTLSSSASLTLAGQVQYISIPSGQSLTINPAESYGNNYATLTAGASASASSSYSCGGSNADPNVVLSGIDDAEGSNYICNGRDGTVWSATATDPNPTITVSLKNQETIDRIFLSSFSIGSSLTGLRNYQVQVNNGSGSFSTVATISNEFYNRNMLITISPQTVSQIRITAMQINYSGYGDGLPPTFWNSSFNVLDPIYDIEAYGPGSNAYYPSAQAEAESGSLTGSASVKSNSAASAGAYVQLGQ